LEKRPQEFFKPYAEGNFTAENQNPSRDLTILVNGHSCGIPLLRVKRKDVRAERPEVEWDKLFPFMAAIVCLRANHLQYRAKPASNPSCGGFWVKVNSGIGR
jgi:hypothetical protein